MKQLISTRMEKELIDYIKELAEFGNTSMGKTIETIIGMNKDYFTKEQFLIELRARCSDRRRKKNQSIGV